MKPDNSVASAAALLLLRSMGENKFDYSLDGPRLQTIDIGCRLCSETDAITTAVLVKLVPVAGGLVRIRCTSGVSYSTECAT